MNPDPYAPLDPDTPFRLDHVLNFFTSLGVWVAIVVGVSAAALISWRLHSPETYEERFATPARLLRWRLWAYASWHRLCKRCGLSASEQITRRNKEGHQVTSTRWFHPKLLGTDVSHTTLRLTVRARMGQTVEDLERAVPAIRDAAGAYSARAVVVSPGTLRIELVNERPGPS
jgi:S-DNA-T family DNA segregation ATPase FtsK/SpoIIIE